MAIVRVIKDESLIRGRADLAILRVHKDVTLLGTGDMAILKVLKDV